VEMMVPLEQRAPENCQQHRRDEKLREVAQARGPKLATLDAAIDELRERLDPARDHILVVELGELGMLVPFGDEKPHDNGAARTDELLNEMEERTLEQRLDREVRRLDLFADHLEMRGDNAADHRLEQLDLGPEVKIRKAFAHLCPGRDIFKSRAGKALGGEFLEGGCHDLLWANLLFPAPFSRACQLPLSGLCFCHGSPLAFRAATPLSTDIYIMTGWSVLQGV